MSDFDQVHLNVQLLSSDMITVKCCSMEVRLLHRMEVREHGKLNCCLLNAHKRYFFIKRYLHRNILLIYFYSQLSEKTGYLFPFSLKFLQIVPENRVGLTLNRTRQPLLYCL